MKSIKHNKFKISRANLFLIICCLLAILKIVLVSNEEIIARYQPLDDYWHVLAAIRGYWSASNYTNITFVHLPIYSLWLNLIYHTGVPLRVAIELLFLFSGFLFVLSLSKLYINRFVCTIVYFLIIFHPASFQLFNYTLPDTLYAPLFLLAMAAMIMMWINRGQKACLGYAVLSGIIFSMLWNLRKENLLILSLILLLALIAFIVLRKDGLNWRSILQQISIMTFVPILVIYVVSLTVQTINYNKFGLFVSTEMSAPGYTAAYKALLRIKPAHSIRFIPVSKDVRRAAYAVSPAFKELEPYFEGEFGYAAASETRKYVGIQGEIASGWFYWALRDATALAGHHTSASDANAYYQKIADEINKAIDSGHLQGRFVVSSFLDPELSNYLPYLPDSYLKMWRLFTSIDQTPIQKDPTDIDLTVRKAFDIIANRRTALTSYDTVTLQGWVFQGSEPIKQVLIKSAGGALLGHCEALLPRPDVAKAFSSQGNVAVPVNSGFTLTVAQIGQQLDDAQVVFVNDEKKEFAIPFKGIVVGKPVQSVAPNAKQNITYAFDLKSVPNTLTLRNTMQSLIWAAYGRFVIFLSCLAVASLLVLLCCYRFINLNENIYMIMILLLFAVLTRVSLFALIDASSWPGNQTRYLFPVMPIYTCFLILIVYQTACVVRQAINKIGKSNI
jgi:hypothetical protein